jgi:hypothetical protein
LIHRGGLLKGGAALVSRLSLAISQWLRPVLDIFPARDFTP